MTGNEDKWPSTSEISLDEIVTYNDPVTRRKMSPEDIRRIWEAKAAVMNNKDSDIKSVLAYSNGWKGVWEAGSKTLVKFDQAMSQLKAIQWQISSMYKKWGMFSETWPIIWTLRKMNPYDTDAQVLRAQLQGLVPTIARGIYWEVWVLTDNDIKLYSKTLPTLQGTEEINKWVLAMTLDTIAGWYLNQLRSLAGLWYNVSDLGWVYDNIKWQADALRQELGINGTADEEDDDIF
jgi:hypothetical protein